MEFVAGLLGDLSLDGFPAGVGGCRGPAGGAPHGCCEYDVSVFDERTEPDTIVEIGGGGLAAVHHCTLSETRSNVLAQLADLHVVRDERWDLRMMLSRVRARRGRIYRDYMRNCLVDALFCITKARGGLAASDPLAPCWTKCAAFYLADAVLLGRGIRPRPSHMLGDARALGPGGAAGGFSVVNECVGTERATPVLLERMAESAAGLSDEAEGNGRSRIIRAKAAYLIRRSLLADCYFYLGYVGRNNLVMVKDGIASRPGMVHLLRVALDLEADPAAVERHAGALHEAVNRMLSQ